jgi:hypothetical protein
MHYGSGSAKAKSCGSSSDSTTLQCQVLLERGGDSRAEWLFENIYCSNLFAFV